ncbi:MAG: DUF2764 family protein [Bacteroidaceae bacterium]|nr:DUF2764 family protein [Bacteroidaceae bacterium]
MSEYHCLVSGLPDISFDGSKVNFSIEKFKEDVYPSLSSSDAKLIDLFFYAWDNENIMALLKNGYEADMKRVGHFTREELVELVSSSKSGDARTNAYPSYMYDFLESYFATEARENVMYEDILASYYYNYAMECGNRFIAEWFGFCRNMNNLQVAFTARKYKLNVADCVVGDDEITETIRSSSARDFSLSSTLDYIETVQRLCEMDRLEERERQMDELKWKWLDENSVFLYFTVERLYVFLQKLDIAMRWAKLDAETGMERYKELIANLKSGLTINDEDYQ